MSHCPGMEERLNDSVDDLLSAAEQAEVDRHVAGCADCREVLSGLRSLREDAAALSPMLEPPRDLWPGIDAALVPRGRVLRPARWRMPSPRWVAALAAAAVVLAATAALLLVDPTSGPTTGDEVSQVSWGDAEADYVVATRDLMEVLDARREELSPETLAVVDDNLRIINQAIHEVRDALENDPGHAGGEYLVASLYRKKVALLQQAVRLPAKG